jgi:hypothetical protein
VKAQVLVLGLALQPLVQERVRVRVRVLVLVLVLVFRLLELAQEREQQLRHLKLQRLR